MTATYRLQLHAGFTFADAERVVPYVSRLGVTHLYLSPVLQATAGSMHGYDVVDHGRVNEELGGQAGLERLAATAREHGLGLVVDVVPNHMALAAPLYLNGPLWHVLAEGPGSPYATWFDVDWDALDGKLGLPLLWDTLEATFEAGRLVLAEHDGRQVLRHEDHVFPVAEGTEGDDVREVLARQHYVLAGWREKDRVLNYRRFFDIEGLVGVRVEDPDVFEATHRVLLDLNHRGVLEGFRIDHPDGLADPEGYLRALRRASRVGTAVWVEKILEPSEHLPTGWMCDGTTGYDALRAITAALVDPTTASLLEESWRGVGGAADFEAVVEEAKREVVGSVLVPERDRLVRRAAEFADGVDTGRLTDAVTELLVAADVYRAYARPGRPAEGEAVEVLRHARDRAAAARPDLSDVLDRLLDVAAKPSPSAPAECDFATRLQQTWGPVMAKSVEDTAFYRWHLLTALNEVGGDPTLVGTAGPELLHLWATEQQSRWPLGMTTLSTHDTKRSEDVRARLLALAGDAESWALCTEAFAEAAEEQGVDAVTAHLLWQTLAGVGDISGDRLTTYLTKAVREAKQHTAWIDGDPDYEQRVLALGEEARTQGRLRALVDTALDHNRGAVRALVLGQKLLQLTVPGVPDTYQGCELVNLALVDPDNRHAVDYDARERRLDALRGEDARPADLDDEKLLLTHRTLLLRKELRHCFGDTGSYHPVVSSTRHAVGFTRGEEVAVLVTRAPARLEAGGGWGDHAVTLPAGLWRDELTETLHEGGAVRCDEAFATMPVALLRRVHI
ncbi:malto-oligosyltrehalose synthase [Nocardioides iriomotensis]|uniref:Malto-oligosyltrehalose synthase n=1 Tax=Nocardioides iriomotensis TaxID=715784 RepID=A0A4Q5JAB2_9ACTN|nr:malto-oligosyltrehalose synthase [Nocardioides iriomotensis]RYU15680.1 malto-oligosyltrehalose synthase [Nocardioides iriomotensis]